MPIDSSVPYPHADFDLLGHLEQQPSGSESSGEPAPPQNEMDPLVPGTPEERLAYGGSALPTLPEDAPLRPEELLALEEEVETPFERTTKRSMFSFKLPSLGKKPLLIGGSVLGALVLIGVGYAVFMNTGGNGEAPPPPPAPLITENPEPPLPEVLIPLTSTGTIAVRETSAAASELKALFGKPTDAGSLRGVLLKLETEKEKRYFTFDEMLDALGFVMTDEVRATLNPALYTLFTYGESDGTTRVGFVVKVRESEPLRSTLAARESQLAEDTDEMLRSLGRASQPTTPEFRGNVRRDLTIRYLNFPDPNLTLDYAIDSTRQLLVFSTSRDSMFAVIDVLPAVQ